MKIRKNKKIKLSKIALLFLGIALLLWNCENEQEPLSNQVNQNSFLDHVKLERSSMNSFAFSSNFSKSYSNKNEEFDLTSWANKNDFYFNPNNFIKTIDSIGNEAYTTSLYIKNTPNNVFYNLVIPKKAENNFASNPLIIEYQLAEGTKKDFKISTQNPFVGNITVYTLSNFKNPNIKAKDSTVDANPCMENKVTTNSNSNGSSSSGASGVGNVGNNNGSEPTNSYGINIGVRTFFISSEGGGSQQIEWGVGIFDFPDLANVNYSKSESNNTITCPDGRIVTALVTDENCLNGKFINGVCVLNTDDDIIDHTNNDCVGKIIQKLQEKDRFKSLVPDLTGVSHLSQTILDLFGKCKNYDLEIKINELGSDTNGNEINGKTYKIESITLDDDLVKDATLLSIAKTLIHESLHVFINFKTGLHNNDMNLTLKLNEYFIKYNYDNNLTQHNFMSQFVEGMAFSLSAFDNHRQNISYYEKLCWGGLESSDAYKSKSQIEKDEIQKIIINEREANSDAKSTKCD